jgi:hypothetical protein
MSAPKTTDEIPDDKEFYEEVLESVSDEGDAWTFRADGGCLCVNKVEGIDPKLGDTVRFYGRGFGYTVRGVAVNGRIVRYMTREEETRKHAEWCANYDREQAAATEAFKASGVMSKPPLMKVATGREQSYAEWKLKNVDPYSGTCFLFAEKWASLIEAEIAKGKTVADVADACSSEADKEFGVTGFMFGMAVSILAEAWEHGDALRRWHNLKTQLGDEGERANREGKTLNPALLRFGGAS